MTHRHREQARSHRGSRPGTKSVPGRDQHCGSEPAREEAISATTDTTANSVIPSKSNPQFTHQNRPAPGPPAFFTHHPSNLLSNTNKRDLIPAFHFSGTGKRCSSRPKVARHPPP